MFLSTINAAYSFYFTNYASCANYLFILFYNGFSMYQENCDSIFFFNQAALEANLVEAYSIRL